MKNISQTGKQIFLYIYLILQIIYTQTIHLFIYSFIQMIKYYDDKYSTMIHFI